MSTLLLRGGRIIDPASELDQTGDILIRDGVIESISHLALDVECDTIDCGGCIITPGLLDIHVHFREPSAGRHEETIRTGSMSAAKGGFTTVCTMPNTSPATDTVESISTAYGIAREVGLCNVFPTCCATIGRLGETLAPIDEMCKLGAIAITDDGVVVASDDMMIASLRAAKKNDVPFMQHCQDPTTTVGGVMHGGAIQEELGYGPWPRIAEESIIERDIYLNEQIGASWHAQHLSSGGSVEIIRRARANSQPISGEASPHHLLLTDRCCKSLGTQAKMNPPLREQSDIDAIKEGIADGTITVLATDHAPHPESTKSVSFKEASFGVVGLDCALALYVKALIEDGVIEWMQMISMMTVQPASLIRRPELGRLTEGGAADITIIDPDHAWTIQKDSFATTGRNCPFDGWEVSATAIATIFGGKITYQALKDRANNCNSLDFV